MELCKAFHGLLLISLIYFQTEVMGKICEQSIESPYGSVREIHPRALTDKRPNKSDGVARYRELYHLITETIYRNSINTESVSPHQDIKVHSVYKLPRIARRHLNMATEGEKEELMDLVNLDNKKNILGRSRHESIYPSRNYARFTSHFKMRMSTEKVPESSSVMKNNDEETEFTLSVAKENDSIQKSKNIIDNKQTSLFVILFTRDPNRYLLKRKRDDKYYFLRLQNSFDRDRKTARYVYVTTTGHHTVYPKGTTTARHQTLDPFWPRATRFRKRRKTAKPYNPFAMQNRTTKMPEFIHFSHKEKIPKRKSKNKSHFKSTTKFKDFGPSAQKKIPILFADLSGYNVGKMSGREYSENADKVGITLGERMEGVLSEDKTEENTESSFSTNQALSKENMTQENLEFTETDSSSPTKQTTGVKDAAGTKPESTEVDSSSPGEQTTDKISTESLEPTAADSNSQADLFNENEDTTETKSESIKSKDNTSTDKTNSREHTYTENSKSAEFGNILSTAQTTVVLDTSETNTESTEKNSNFSGELATDNTSAESSTSREVGSSSPGEQATDKMSTESLESTAADSNSPTDLFNENEDTTETKSESINSKDNTSIDKTNSRENTYTENSKSAEFGNSLSTAQTTVVLDTSKTNTESTEKNSNSSGELATDNTSAESSTSREVGGSSPLEKTTDKISTESLESTAVYSNSSTDLFNENEDTTETKSESINSKDNTSIDKTNSSENTYTENSKSVEFGNSLSTAQITVVPDTSETNTESTEKNSNSSGGLATDSTSSESSTSREVDNSSSTDQSSEKESTFEAKSESTESENSSLPDHSNSKEKSSVENWESTEAGNILPIDKTTRYGNTSETISESTATDNSSSEALNVDNDSAENLESIKANTTKSAERIYRGYEANSSLIDQINSKENTSADDLEYTKASNSSPTNQTTRVGNASQTSSELIKAVSSIPERMAADNTSTGSSESIKANTTETTKIINRGYGANSSLTDQSNSKGNTSAEKFESKEAANSLLTNQITRAVNTSEANSKSIAENNTSLGALTADNGFVASSESINVNTTESTERIYGGYEANSSLTDQFNSKVNTSADNLESVEADNNLPTNTRTTVGNTSQINSKPINAGSSSTQRLAADNTSTGSVESIKVNTTEATEIIYRGHEANSSQTDQSNNKGITSTNNYESKEVGNSLPTNQTTEVENMSEKKPESIEEVNSFPGRLVIDNTSAESLESNATEPIERIYRNYRVNSSQTAQSYGTENTPAENPESTEAGNNLPKNQTTRVGNTSQRNPESINAGSTFPENLAADNISGESLEYIKVNTTETTEIIHRGYGANSSLMDPSNSKGNTSAEKFESKEAANSLLTNQIIRAVNTSERKSKSIEENNSSSGALTAENSFVESSESIKVNTTESEERIYGGYEANSSLTDQFNSKTNMSADDLESVEADNNLPTNKRTTVGKTSQTNSKSINAGNNSTQRLAADNTSTGNVESIKANTTEATERIYRGHEANSSLTDQSNNKGITSTNNYESKEVGKSLPINQTTEVGNMSEKKPESIEEVNNFPGKLVIDNTSEESLESNATEPIERIYRVNSSQTAQSNGNENTPAENPESTEAGNNLPANQATRIGNTSQWNPESVNAGSTFPEKLATDNTSGESLESVKSNTAETTERIYRSYRANSSLIDQSNNKGNTSAENSDINMASNSLPTNQTARVGNMSEMKPKSVEAGNSFPGRLATDKTSAESLESIKSNATLSTERIYSGYEVNSSLIGKSNSKENTSADNSESTEAGESLPTNQTRRVGNASETNAELIEENNNFPGRLAADNSPVESSESIKTNTTESTGRIYRGNEGNSSESREEGSSSNRKEKNFIDSLEYIKAGNSTPEMGNISPVADNSSSLGDKSSIAADNSSAEAGRSSPLEYDVHKISPSEHYLHKSSPLSPDRSASPDKENMKSPNPKA